MASFPTSTATKPASIVAGQAVIVTDVGNAWDEIVALENILRGSSTLAAAGTNLNIKSGATGAVPLVLQGFAGQTADILSIGTSAGTADLFRFKPDGKLNIVTTGTTGGLQLGSSSATQVYSAGTDLVLRPGTDATGGVRVVNAAAGSTVMRIDTSNLRVALGENTAPSALLHLLPNTATTTAAQGIQFGNDATNLYRSAATTLKTDGDFSVGGSVVLNDVAFSRVAANVMGMASGDSIRLLGSNSLQLHGDSGTVSQILVTKSAASNLTDIWFAVNAISGETSSRYRITAAGQHTWTDGTNPGTPVQFGINGANLGLVTNKNLYVQGGFQADGTATFGLVNISTGMTFLGGGGEAIKRGATDSSYAGSGSITAYAKDFEISTTAATTPTRLVLRRPDGTRRFIRLDNDDQIIIEAS